MRTEDLANVGTEPRICGCGTQFVATVLRIGGRALMGGRLCDACVKKAEESIRPVDDRAGRMMELLDSVGVNIRKHGGCTLENWEAGDSDKPVAAAREFIASVGGAGWAEHVRGLYLTGDTGTGKTHLAVGILREVLMSARIDPVRVVFDRAARLITEIQDTYGTGGTEKVLAKRENAALWVLDDFGAEKASENVLRIFTDLFSAREGHPTVITSNLDPHSLTARWSGEDWARLSSRLASQNFRAVSVKGADRRFGAA